jgi:hypothetical protein
LKFFLAIALSSILCGQKLAYMQNGRLWVKQLPDGAARAGGDQKAARSPIFSGRKLDRVFGWRSSRHRAVGGRGDSATARRRQVSVCSIEAAGEGLKRFAGPITLDEEGWFGVYGYVDWNDYVDIYRSMSAK